MSKQEDIKVEAALARLEQIVSELESDEVDLEASLALFEEGVRLADQVGKKLEAGELRIKQVLEKAEGFSAEDFQL